MSQGVFVHSSVMFTLFGPHTFICDQKHSSEEWCSVFFCSFVFKSNPQSFQFNKPSSEEALHARYKSAKKMAQLVYQQKSLMRSLQEMKVEEMHLLEEMVQEVRGRKWHRRWGGRKWCRRWGGRRRWRRWRWRRWKRWSSGWRQRGRQGIWRGEGKGEGKEETTGDAPKRIV